jgi:hypothetical protein
MCYAVKSLGLKKSPKSGNRYHAAKIIHMKRFAWETLSRNETEQRKIDERPQSPTFHDELMAKSAANGTMRPITAIDIRNNMPQKPVKPKIRRTLKRQTSATPKSSKVSVCVCACVHVIVCGVCMCNALYRACININKY